MAAPRIYLTGPLLIEHGDDVVDERALPGRQGKLALTWLVVSRHAPLPREEVVAAIWRDEPPAQPDPALDALLSKLRTSLRKCAPGTALEVRAGSVALRLPATTWVDIEAAINAIDEAGGALRRGDVPAAWSLANVAAAIARRPFLPDLEAPWIEAQRSSLRRALVRALDCLTITSAAIGDAVAAVQYAAQVVALEPFRETGYQRLMRMHAAAGDRAEALRVFAQCRALLRDELGVSPSPQTEAVFIEILRAGAPSPEAEG